MPLPFGIMSITLHEMQRRLKGFDIREEVRQVIIETKGEIEELNRGQLFLGKRADGSYIGPDYTPFTKQIKEEKGQPFDRVTLRDKGHFWNSIEVDSVNSETYNIFAQDPKTAALVKKYGGKILGLSKESRTEEYIPFYFFPALKKRIETKTGLKFN